MADNTDPGLKAATRGLARGSQEYQKAVAEYNAQKAKLEGEAQDRAARIAREAAESESRRKREEDEAASNRQIREQNEAAERQRKADEQKAEKDRRTSLIGASASGAGLAAGLGGGYLADKYGTAKANATLTARKEGAANLAQAARDIDPSQPGARLRYGEIGTAADKTGVLKPRVLPIGGLGVAAGLAGMGAYSTWHRAPEAKSDEERALWTGTGYGELGAGAKMLASSAHRYANPQIMANPGDVADIEYARKIGAGNAPIGGFQQAQAPQPGGPPAGPGTPPPQQPQGGQPTPLRNSERLINAAKAAGASGKITKAAAIKHLQRNINDGNRAAVAAALNVKPGPNFSARTRAAIKTMATRGKSGLFFPLAAGAMAYDAARGQAQAAGADEASSQLSGGLAGAAAAGTTAAIPYALSKLPSMVGQAAGGTLAAPSAGMIDTMTDYSPDEVAQMRNMAARYLPSWAQNQAISQAGEMATPPPRNPLFSGGIDQGGGDNFESALGDVLSYIDNQ